MNFLENQNKVYLEDDKGKIVAEVGFTLAGDKILIIDKTIVDDNFRGQGLASKMIKRVVEIAKEQNRKVIPLCPAAKREFEKNPNYKEIEY